MRSSALKAVLCAVGLTAGSLLAASAHASLIGFVDNAADDSALWTDYVTGPQQEINTDITFDAGENFGAHPLGSFLNAPPLGSAQSRFYASAGASSDGPTLPEVAYGAGPGGAGISGTRSPGEGPHPASNYVAFTSGEKQTLTITFNRAIVGVGLFVVDLFGYPGSSVGSTLAIEAFDEAGTSLGSVSSLDLNLQPNNMYFMGLASDAPDIRSFVLSSDGRDNFGVDNIVFAEKVPEPASLALLGLGLTLFGVVRAKRAASSPRA
jgi:hypothetical protein